MNTAKVSQILRDNDFIHTSGTAEEKKVAEYLRSCCEEMGVSAHIESFPVQMAQVHEGTLTVDGVTMPCKGYKLCGSGEVTAPLCYLPNTDRYSLRKAKGRIVMLDSGVPHFLYQDLLDNGMVGFITYDGNIHYADDDIDHKELRPHVSLGRKVPGVNVNAKTARQIAAMEGKEVTIRVKQDEYEGESWNTVAEIPGETDEMILLTAHMDTTPLSRGSYDNLTGCIGLLGVMEEMLKKKPRYTLRFVFCGSEERGLLGSKAYCAQHEAELEKTVLNINLDMLGTYMGRFISCVSAEEKMVHYIQYLAAELGFGMDAHTGVYASDSTPVADRGVPALSFARLTTPSQSNIHTRYDTPELVSPEQMLRDIAFVTEFTRHMACARVCPVGREIPEKVKKELDEYLLRKRRDA